MLRRCALRNVKSIIVPRNGGAAYTGPTMEPPQNRLADLRKSYELAELDETAASSEPRLQFELWLQQALNRGPMFPT